MGKLTRTQIVTQGMILAGRTDAALVSLVNTQLNAWLRSTYKGWLWPFLCLQATAVPLAAAAQSLSIGGGAGTITGDVADLFDPIYIYNSGYTLLGRARIRQSRGGAAEREPSIINPATNAGVPFEFKARPSNTVEGVWTLTPYPFPDRALLLSIDYKVQPADLSLDADVPRYENDRTLIQAAKVFTLEYSKDESYQAELEILASMVLQDFAKDAAKTGSGDNLGMDPNTFK